MRRERWIAVLLAVFFGWFGAHKFYLGQPWWGLAYLLFSETGVPALIGFFEGLYYLLLMTSDDFDKEYNCPRAIDN